MRKAPIILLLISAALLAVGIFLDEPTAVWQKGVAICMSCIGIG